MIERQRPPTPEDIQWGLKIAAEYDLLKKDEPETTDSQ